VKSLKKKRGKEKEINRTFGKNTKSEKTPASAKRGKRKRADRALKRKKLQKGAHFPRHVLRRKKKLKKESPTPSSKTRERSAEVKPGQHAGKIGKTPLPLLQINREPGEARNTAEEGDQHKTNSQGGEGERGKRGRTTARKTRHWTAVTKRASACPRQKRMKASALGVPGRG